MLSDHNNGILNMAKRAIQGAIIGGACAFVGDWWKIADKKIIADRSTLDPMYFLSLFLGIFLGE